jgi:hypothetical protein
MKAFTIFALAIATIAANALVSIAADHHAERAKAKPAHFEKFKALIGEWEMVAAPGDHGGMAGTVIYKVTAGGNAVEETVFAGSEHEMVTLYYVEGNGMALTHYCMLGNRPHMRALATSDPNKITFRCPDGEDPALEAEEHMHQAAFTFIDADHLKSAWTLSKDGKAGETHAATFVRKKK